MRREPVYDAYFDEYGQPTVGRTYDRIWFTVREAAEKTGVSVRTMRQYIADGKIHAVKKNNVLWIGEWTLNRFIGERIKRKSKKGIDT